MSVPTLILRRGAWGLSFAVLVLIAVVAVDRTLGGFLGPILADFPGPYGRAGLLFAALYAAASGVALIVAWRAAAGEHRHRIALPLAIVLLAVGVRVVVAALLDGVIRGETEIVRAQALGVLDGACCFSHRPMGYPIVLAGAFRLLGIGPTAVEALNLAFAAVTAWLTYDIGRVGWDRRVGALAGTAYAVIPSQVLFVLVPLTEPMFTVTVAVAVRLALALPAGTLRAGVGIGVALAAALAIGQYVRATAASLIGPIVVVPFLVGWRWRLALAHGLLVVAAFVVLMLPVVAFNLRAHGDLSVSTSAYGGWSLYVGANREHGGMWNAEDAARLATFPGDTWWDRSEYAGSLVGDRIMADPIGALMLLPEKFETMWADETYAAQYALQTGPPTRDVWAARLTAQLVWAPLVLLAAFGVLPDRNMARPAVLLIGLIVTLVAFTHLALEVHGRYHSYLVPLLCVLAAAGVRTLHGWRLAASRALRC